MNLHKSDKNIHEIDKNGLKLMNMHENRLELMNMHEINKNGLKLMNIHETDKIQ